MLSDYMVPLAVALVRWSTSPGQQYAKSYTVNAVKILRGHGAFPEGMKPMACDMRLKRLLEEPVLVDDVLVTMHVLEKKRMYDPTRLVTFERGKPLPPAAPEPPVERLAPVVRHDTTSPLVLATDTAWRAAVAARFAALEARVSALERRILQEDPAASVVPVQALSSPQSAAPAPSASSTDIVPPDVLPKALARLEEREQQYVRVCAYLGLPAPAAGPVIDPAGCSADVVVRCQRLHTTAVDAIACGRAQSPWAGPLGPLLTGGDVLHFLSRADTGLYRIYLRHPEAAPPGHPALHPYDPAQGGVA